MWLTLACASESITRTFLPWSLASVSASARTRVDLPTPPLAFMTVMVLRIVQEPPMPAARTTAQAPRQGAKQGDFVTRPRRSQAMPGESAERALERALTGRGALLQLQPGEVPLAAPRRRHDAGARETASRFSAAGSRTESCPGHGGRCPGHRPLPADMPRSSVWCSSSPWRSLPSPVGATAGARCPGPGRRPLGEARQPGPRRQGGPRQHRPDASQGRVQGRAHCVQGRAHWG